MRLRFAPWCMPGSDLDQLVDLQAARGRRWSVAGVKFFIDGTVEGGTAWLERPDCHGGSTGPFWLDPADSMVVAARHGESRPGLALPGPHRRRSDARPRLGLADRALRPARGARHDHAAPPPRLPGVAAVRPEQALAGLTALESMTSQTARASGEEPVAGRIAPGYRADLTAFGVDPVTAPPDELADAPVRLTMVGGSLTHIAAVR